MTFYPKEVVELFPRAGVSGADTTAIKTKQMQKAAELKTPLTYLEIKNIVFIALVTLKLIMFESNISETSKGRAMINDIYLIDIARPSKKL